jgi:hypothetical protein
LLGLVWQCDAALFARPENTANIQYHHGCAAGGVALSHLISRYQADISTFALKLLSLFIGKTT